MEEEEGFAKASLYPFCKPRVYSIIKSIHSHSALFLHQDNPPPLPLPIRGLGVSCLAPQREGQPPPPLSDNKVVDKMDEHNGLGSTYQATMYRVEQSTGRKVVVKIPVCYRPDRSSRKGTTGAQQGPLGAEWLVSKCGRICEDSES